MRPVPGQFGQSPRARWALAILVFAPALVIGQLAQPAPTSARAPLPDRQAAVQERLTRLESTMLKLSRLLQTQEPDNAQRLRDALEQAGERRIKSRVADVVGLLRSQSFSDADRKQEELIADFEQLLGVLTSRGDELDRRREERQRLQKLRRAIRTLMEDQEQTLYHTQHAERPEPEAGDGPGRREMLKPLEQMQRGLQQRAEDLSRQMQPKSEGSRQRPETPGRDSMERSAEDMRHAGDRLNEGRPGEAKPHETDAIQRMQQALDELDDALRQTRKDEVEQTLDALQSRIQEMLARQQEVRAAIDGWLAKTPESRRPEDHALLAESAKTQAGIVALNDETLGLLLDEGSTVIVPEILRQLRGDLVAIEADITTGNPTAGTRAVVDDALRTLEELLGAIERKQKADRQQEADEPPQPQQAGNEPQQALLPRSAELRMLRSSQLRLNARTPADDEPSATPLRAELSSRQRRLSALARQMYDGDQP